MGELPLELLLQILSPLDAKDLIRWRAVNRRWRLVIDQYLLLELTLCKDRLLRFPPHPVFQAHNRTHSDSKRTIMHMDIESYERCLAEHRITPGYERNADLNKIQYLFRNIRTLSIFEREFDADPMDEFINSFDRLKHLTLISAVVKSIRLPNLKTLAIYARLGDEDEPYEHKEIDCPNLASFSYRPRLKELELFGDDYVWNFPILKKLKMNRCQKFMKNLKQLEVLIVMTFYRTDKQLLRELPQLKFLYVQKVEDGQSFCSLQDEFGEIQIYYRALPLRYARDKIRSRVPSELWKAGQNGWDFDVKQLEFYRGYFEHLSEEIHFYTDFIIDDYCRALESSFFSRFVDVTSLAVIREHTLSQAELLRIFGSFPNVREIFSAREAANIPPPHLISTVCPAYRPYSECELISEHLLKSVYQEKFYQNNQINYYHGLLQNHVLKWK